MERPVIHLKAIWLNNNSRRSQRLQRKYEAAERELRLTKELIAELQSTQPRNAPWWVTIN
jgi:hypothetical protein